MTFPSLRKILFIAPVFVVGIAAACGPDSRSCNPGAPASIPPMPAQAPVVTYYYQPVTNAQGQTTYVVRTTTAAVPPSVAGTSLSVLNGKLHLQGVDGSKMSCEKLTILVSGVEPAEVSIADKLIKITIGKDVKDGDFLQATAQKVTRTGTEGGTLVLEGSAKLVYVRKGKKLESAAEGISVNLSTGQVVSEMGAMPAAEDGNRPGVVSPLPPSVPSGSVSPGYPVSPGIPYGSPTPSLSASPSPSTNNSLKIPQWTEQEWKLDGLRY